MNTKKLISKVRIIRKKLKKGTPTIGGWVQFSSVGSLTVMLEKHLFEWLTLDMEHGEIDFKEAISLIKVIKGQGIPPLIRLRESNSENIKYSLECGALGLIYPNMCTYEEVKEKIDYSMYHKKRGVGFSISNSFGAHLNDHLKFKPLNIVMIENTEIIENFEKIKNISDIDAFLIGPYDLKNSFIKKNKELNFEKYLLNFYKYLNKNKIKYGIHIVKPDKKVLKQTIKKGSLFLPFGIDSTILEAGMSKM